MRPQLLTMADGGNDDFKTRLGILLSWSPSPPTLTNPPLHLPHSCSHPVHVKEEPTEVEEDSRPVSLLAGVTHSLALPSNERDLEEDLPTEELE